MHVAIMTLIEKVRNEHILSQITEQKVRKEATTADVKRAFDFIDRNSG